MVTHILCEESFFQHCFIMVDKVEETIEENEIH